MPIDYSLIRARPTKYRDILFRSQLEAIWAAFFDQIAWQWEYEPFELNGWLPDFLLHGKGQDVLVEVKPVHITDHEIEKKIAAAAKDCNAHLMICGRQPYFDESGILVSLASLCKCGNPSEGWMRRALVQDTVSMKYDIIFGHWHKENTLSAFRSGQSVENDDDHPIDQFIGREIAALWAQAKNAMQWHPQR